MIRLISTHTWSLALLEIRKLKSERDSLRGTVDRLTQDAVTLRQRASDRLDEIVSLDNEVARLKRERDELRGIVGEVYHAIEPEWELLCDVHPEDAEDINCGWKRTVVTISWILKGQNTPIPAQEQASRGL